MLEAGERDGHLGFSSEQSLGMPGRGGHGEPPVVRPKGALDRGVKVPSRYALSDL